MEAIRWFGEIGLTDVGLVGGKGANLGELATAGLPVPPGFVVTAAAYVEAVSESGGRARVARLFGRDQSYRCRAGWREGRQPWRADDRRTARPAELRRDRNRVPRCRLGVRRGRGSPGSWAGLMSTIPSRL